MPSKYLKQPKPIRHDDCQDPIFNSRDEMKQSLSRLCYGNLHVIGRIWVEGVKSALIGTRMCLIPTVEAAKKEEVPKRPPKMKYNDLPLYDSPHLTYKQYLDDEANKCLGKNNKILQCMALGTVSGWRKAAVCSISDLVTFIKECSCELKDMVKEQSDCIICSARKQDETKKGAVVLLGTTTAYLISARRTPHYYQRAFWTAIAAVSTGWLCFPKETDERVRAVGRQVHQIMKKLYNFWYDIKPLSAKAPCEGDIPPLPVARKPNPKHYCPPKK